MVAVTLDQSFINSMMRLPLCTASPLPMCLGVQVEAALRTALQLRRYDDILDSGLVYAFLALVGFYSNFYGTCSKVRPGSHVA
jgi:hypothetical protein